jgi:4-phospho-D-threonate 3-dehydrogenase / 4-phospho-D-erythronate 3-dehydrogenase
MVWSAVAKPRLVISSGDPAGIGPEVTVKAAAQPQVAELAELIVTGDPALLGATARDLKLPLVLRVVAAGDASEVRPGRLSAEGGRAAVAAVERAVQLINQGEADALVTAPINKEALRLAGYPWPGHTEMLADLTRTKDVRMLLTTGRLRVVHVSTHRSLRSAVDAVTRERVLRTIQLADEAGQMLGVPKPRIGVAGLNPHAGESGLFGDEEQREIMPAVEDAIRQGINVSGPWPADTLFWQAANGEFDLVVAMYHDQGHIPVKLMGFDTGVNITLGLPIVRTSVDHGTAFDIAGKGIARWESMAAAIALAADIVGRR